MRVSTTMLHSSYDPSHKNLLLILHTFITSDIMKHHIERLWSITFIAFEFIYDNTMKQYCIINSIKICASAHHSSLFSFIKQEYNIPEYICNTSIQFMYTNTFRIISYINYENPHHSASYSFLSHFQKTSTIQDLAH